MTTKDIEPRTVGRTKFYQGEGMTAPLFCIEPGISELMGYVGDMTLTGAMDDKPQLV